MKFVSDIAIETPRMHLRPLKPTDATALVKLRSDDEVNKFIKRPKSISLEDALKFINERNESIQKNTSAYWAITLKNDDELIGTSCLFNFDVENSRAEIGYELSPAHQGYGLAQEATTAVIDFAINRMQIETLVAWIMKGNKTSERLIQKHNFLLDKKEEYGDEESRSIFNIYYLKR